jgi:hypothetical protein
MDLCVLIGKPGVERSSLSTDQEDQLTEAFVDLFSDRTWKDKLAGRFHREYRTKGFGPGEIVDRLVAADVFDSFANGSQQIDPILDLNLGSVYNHYRWEKEESNPERYYLHRYMWGDGMPDM